MLIVGYQQRIKSLKDKKNIKEYYKERLEDLIFEEKFTEQLQIDQNGKTNKIVREGVLLFLTVSVE